MLVFVCVYVYVCAGVFACTRVSVCMCVRAWSAYAFVSECLSMRRRPIGKKESNIHTLVYAYIGDAADHCSSPLQNSVRFSAVRCTNRSASNSQPPHQGRKKKEKKKIKKSPTGSATRGSQDFIFLGMMHALFRRGY